MVRYNLASVAVRDCPPRSFFQQLSRHLFAGLEDEVDLADLNIPAPLVEALLSSEQSIDMP